MFEIYSGCSPVGRESEANTVPDNIALISSRVCSRVGFSWLNEKANEREGKVSWKDERVNISNREINFPSTSFPADCFER